MDQDEFQAWKDSPATQWVLRKVLEKTQQVEADLKDRLFYSTGLPAKEWADLQGQAGYDRGFVAGVNFIAALELEEIVEPKRDKPE